MEALFWTTGNGFLCSQGIEIETETAVKLINHARAIPKSVIGNKNKTFYGKHFFTYIKHSINALMHKSFRL